MRRRHYLSALGAGALAATAGCLGVLEPDPVEGNSTDPVPNANVTTRSADIGTLTDADLPLADSDLQRGAPKDSIPAITDPVFGADWSAVKWTLAADDQVIGVAVAGVARAYPLPVLNYHEVVNDDFGGPLLVSFCPLCGSGVTAQRRVDGRETTFGVSGLLWHSDLVMYDTLTDSLWSQVLGKAVRGPMTGTALSLRPSTLTTWGEWREEHPDTQVLLPPPSSETVEGEVSRNYDSDPYPEYDDSERIGIGYGGEYDGRLHPKAEVVGVATDETARAYPLSAVEAAGVVNDTVGDLPVVVAATADGTLVAYERRVDSEVVTFERDGEALVGAGSEWGLLSGTARDGPHEGASLRHANDRSPMFWFAWADFFPESEIYST